MAAVSEGFLFFTCR